MALSYENLVIAPRSQEATNFKVNQLNKVQNQQPSIQQAFNAKNEQSQTRTEKAEERKESSSKFDAKEKGHNEYYRQEAERKKKLEEEKIKKEELKKMLGCSFDITV